jgi:hypothetical protein
MCHISNEESDFFVSNQLLDISCRFFTCSNFNSAVNPTLKVVQHKFSSMYHDSMVPHFIQTELFLPLILMKTFIMVLNEKK